jgi:alanine racemase
MRATKAIIHLDNLIHNIEAVRRHVGDAPCICLPVKADAYGHGAIKISKCALSHGVTHLAVATVDEGIELRAAGIESPILLFSQALPDELREAAHYNLTPFVSDIKYASLLNEEAGRMPERATSLPQGSDVARSATALSAPIFCRRSRAAARSCTAKVFPLLSLARCNAAHQVPLSVFIKVDSGMGRLGCAPKDALPLARFICEQKNITLAGIATHLAVSDSSSNDNIAYTKKQIKVFRAVVNEIKNAGIDVGILSAANSGATLMHSDAHFDMVRPGILLYGYSDEEISHSNTLDIKPVMELVTNIVHIKKIHEGESVSYGGTWKAPHDTYIAILPIGYADGLPRALSGKNFFVGIGGKPYPLVGRICMDQCMIDIGAAPEVNLYDVVSIFGGDNAHAVDTATADAATADAAAIAALTGTIPYEILCNINKRVPRVYQGIDSQK